MALRQIDVGMLEQQLTEAADDIYQGMLDFSISNEELEPAWQGLLHLRSSLLHAQQNLISTPRTPQSIQGQSRYQAAKPKAVPALPAPPYQRPVAATQRPVAAMQVGPIQTKSVQRASSPAGPRTSMPPPQLLHSSQPSEEQQNWKGFLGQVLQKYLKRPIEKEDITYSVYASDPGFVATIHISSFGQAYEGPTMPTKKAAEQAAAKVILEMEFPDFIAEKMNIMVVNSPPAEMSKPSKRKDAAEDVHPKSRLAYAVTLLLGRSASKEDVVYECVEVEPKSYAAFLRLPTYDPESSFEGEIASSKKEAETNAAKAALEFLSDLVAPLEEEQKAKKAKLKKESLQNLKARTAKASQVHLFPDDAVPEVVEGDYPVY
jgi:dsRNA-specific ribonuclease